MTLQEYAAHLLTSAAYTLAHFVMTTEPDKRDWTPTAPEGITLRSPIDFVAECITVNGVFLAILRGEVPPAVSPDDKTRPFVDAEEGCQLLISVTEDLAKTIRSLSDEDFAREYTVRGRAMSGPLFVELPMRNMHYHSGQINLIQLLYGDTEFRPYRPS